MIWVGLLIVIITLIAIIKRFDAKMVLFVSGFLMCLISGQWLMALDTFYTKLFSGGIPQIICAAMGYAALMGFSECDKHLSTVMMSVIKKARAILIPGVIIAGGFVITALGSNAGSAAAIGPVVIPVMIKAGVHPVFAATVLALAVHGDYFMIGSHGAVIGEIAGKSAAEVVMSRMWPTGLAVYVFLIIYTLVLGKVLKEDKGFVDTTGAFSDEAQLGKVNGYKAFMPFLPIVLVLFGLFANKYVEAIPAFSVQQAMLISTCWGLLTLRVNVTEGIKAYTSGLGRGLGEVVSLIAAAGVFAAGMEVIGLIPALITAMESNPAIAIYAAAFGPAAIAALAGSGDAAAMAFHSAVTPHVADLGLDPSSIGSLASMCGAFGRTMSPVAGVTIICAGFAKVNPIDLSKRIALFSIGSIIIGIIMLGYIYQ